MTDIADHDIASIEARYQCPKCGSWETIIMEWRGNVAVIYCRHCRYDERYHGASKFEKPKLWRRILGGKNGR